MNILVPETITADMIAAGTNIPALDAARGEIAWVASGGYDINYERVHNHCIYSCVRAHTATAASLPPPLDATTWLFKGPTNRMAPFDEYVYTRAIAAPEVRYVLRPPFFSGFALYGVEAEELHVILRDNQGQVVWQEHNSMWEQAYGLWEYLYTTLRREQKFIKKRLPLLPHAELEIRVRRLAQGVNAELGVLTIGHWRTLFAPQSTAPGTEFGAEVTPKRYSYFKREADGTYTRRQGRVAKEIKASVLIDASQAGFAEALLTRIQDTPVAIEASEWTQYGFIGAFGFVTGSVVIVNAKHARVSIRVDGNV